MSTLCKKHECIYGELPCPLCVIEERDELRAEVKRLRTALSALYGTVAMQKAWQRRWPVIEATVRDALGLEQRAKRQAE